MKETRRVAAVVLMRADGAALLQHRDDKPGINHPGMWVPPGGHGEPDEAAESCARREFLEETGYQLDRLTFLTRFLDNHDGVLEASELTVFWALYDGVQQPVCREGQQLSFVARDRAPGLQMPPYLIGVWDEAIAAMRAAEGRL
jgi:8-oxo-dGTP pyrophosphatase MutT (NUDIX family)